MQKYNISVDFGEQGFDVTGNIFKVIGTILEHGFSARITVRKA